MKSKWLLLIGIFEIIIGFLGILSFVILSVNGVSVKKWVIAFLTCIYLVTDGIINIKKMNCFLKNVI